MLETQLVRFTDKTLITESGCIIWLGCCDRNGYGKLHLAGKQTYAHIVAYEHWVGPVPEGNEVDHTCRNPSCVAPTHLEAVTPHVNKSRRWRTDPSLCAAGLHEWVEENWYVGSRGNRACAPCARAKARKQNA